MRQPNGCSTPALKSSMAKQWIKEELAQPKEDHSMSFVMPCILEYICIYGTCILFPMMWLELAVHLQSEYEKVDTLHHSNC